MPQDKHALRHLAWNACLNARDLGGYPTVDGRYTRWQALVRSDNLCRLTSAGRTALIEYGVRTIIDLRSPSELAFEPNPFAGYTASDGRLTYHNAPFLDETDTEGMRALDAASSAREMYELMLDRYRILLGVILKAIARAPQGGVLIHCHAGKDRTGIVAALALSLAGVPDEIIIEDFALSGDYLRPVYDKVVSKAQDPAEQERLAWQLATEPETMRATLEHLHARYGSVEAYVRAAGVEQIDIDHIRSWLCT